MHIITFVLVLLAFSVAIYIGTKAFFVGLEHIGLFIWNQFEVPAIRYVQAVIKKSSAKTEQVNTVVETEVTQTQKITEPEPDLDCLDIPTYLRKGKKLIW